MAAKDSDPRVNNPVPNLSETRLWLPRKAFSPISTTVAGKSTVTRFRFPSKALGHTKRTVPGTINSEPPLAIG
jgi:hypothetical protein